jgi:hypothetical protein
MIVTSAVFDTPLATPFGPSRSMFAVGGKRRTGRAAGYDLATGDAVGTTLRWGESRGRSSISRRSPRLEEGLRGDVAFKVVVATP